jgi:nicotinamidase-related amidase
MNKTALLVIDLQRDFPEANGRMSVGARNAALLIAVANRLLQHAARGEYPRQRRVIRALPRELVKP